MRHIRMRQIRWIVIALLLIFIQTGVTAQTIFETIRNGNYEEAEEMIRVNKGWVDSLASGYSPLLYASVLGQDRIVDLLLQNGADINYKIHQMAGMLSIMLLSLTRCLSWKY